MTDYVAIKRIDRQNIMVKMSEIKAISAYEIGSLLHIYDNDIIVMMGISEIKGMLNEHGYCDEYILELIQKGEERWTEGRNENEPGNPVMASDSELAYLLKYWPYSEVTND